MTATAAVTKAPRPALAAGARGPAALLVRTLDRAAALGARPVDASSAAVFRIVFGLVGLIAVVRFFAYGWIDQLYLDAARHFTYVGFGWVQPLPDAAMYAHFVLLGALSLAIAVGYHYRLAAALFFVGFTYVELIDKTTYLNHYYLISLASLLMIFLPLDRVWSVDAWRRARRGAARPAAIPVRVIWLLRAQLAAIYLFAGSAKLNPDWLLEAQPLRIWLHNRADMPLLGPLFAEPATAYLMSYAGALFDLTIVAWLLWGAFAPVRLSSRDRVPRGDLAAVRHRRLPLADDRRDADLLRAGLAATAAGAHPARAACAAGGGRGPPHRSGSAAAARRELAGATGRAGIGGLHPGAGGDPAAPLRLCRQRALERGGLPFFLARAADGEDGVRAIPCPRSRQRAPLAGGSGLLSDAAADRALRNAARHDPGRGALDRGRFCGAADPRCGGAGRCVRGLERAGAPAAGGSGGGSGPRAAGPGGESLGAALSEDGLVGATPPQLSPSLSLNPSEIPSRLTTSVLIVRCKAVERLMRLEERGGRRRWRRRATAAVPRRRPRGRRRTRPGRARRRRRRGRR